MVIKRVGSKSVDKEELKKLEKLAKDGISKDELQTVIEDYEEHQKEDIDPELNFKKKKIEYQQEKAKESFESGSGSFKRSK